MIFSKSKSGIARCPSCFQTHFWSRREMIAYDAGKSVQVKCLMCGQVYWIWKKNGKAIITKEREDD